jgi:hypothetical protein
MRTLLLCDFAAFVMSSVSHSSDLLDKLRLAADQLVMRCHVVPLTCS